MISLTSLLLGASTLAHAQVAELFSAEALPSLKRSQGYVLIGIDSGDTESFLTAKRLESKGRELRLERGQPVETKAGFRLDLADRPKGFYFLVLRTGVYQITEVSYPYFNLPFRLDTTTRPEWRFFVEPGKVNYVGRLIVSRDRSENSVDVNLINRFAADYEDVTTAYASLFQQFPLASGIGIRDDFAELVAAP
ncbi:MAG: hypothetical protein AAGA33_12850 [Pseudomonadota bacterium]